MSALDVGQGSSQPAHRCNGGAHEPFVQFFEQDPETLRPLADCLRHGLENTGSAPVAMSRLGEDPVRRRGWS